MSLRSDYVRSQVILADGGAAFKPALVNANVAFDLDSLRVATPKASYFLAPKKGH